MGAETAFRTPSGYDVRVALYRGSRPFVAVLGHSGIAADAWPVRWWYALSRDDPQEAPFFAAIALALACDRAFRWPVVRDGRVGDRDEWRQPFRLLSRREVKTDCLIPLLDPGKPLQHYPRGFSRSYVSRLLPAYSQSTSSEDRAAIHTLAVRADLGLGMIHVDDDTNQSAVGWAVTALQDLRANGQPAGALSDLLRETVTEAASHDDVPRLVGLYHLLVSGAQLYSDTLARFQHLALEDIAAWIERPAPTTRRLAEAMNAGHGLHELYYHPRPEFGGVTWRVRVEGAKLHVRTPAVLDYARDLWGDRWLDDLQDAFAEGDVKARAQLLDKLTALCAIIGSGRATDHPGIRLGAPHVGGERAHFKRLMGDELLVADDGYRPDVALERQEGSREDQEFLDLLRRRTEEILTSKQRAVFWPCVVEGVSQRQVAYKIGVGESAISERIKAAWNRLKRTDPDLFLQLSGRARPN